MTRDFDPSKPVRTIDGRPARIICTDRKCEEDQSIVALVACSTMPDVEIARAYRTDGRRFRDTLHVEDLVNIPERHKHWVNIYPPSEPSWVRDYHTYKMHKTREEADRGARADRIACIPIEFEEGEGLADLCTHSPALRRDGRCTVCDAEWPEGEWA